MHWFDFSPPAFIIWLLLFVTAVRACTFPEFLRLNKEQRWLSAWKRKENDIYSFMTLEGNLNGSRINFNTGSYQCVKGKCRETTTRINNSYRCYKRVPQARHRHAYIASYKLGASSYRVAYACLKFITRNTMTTSEDLKVFYIIWDNGAYTADDVRQSTFRCTFPNDNNPAYAVWIPTFLQPRTWWNDCPFSGGFQVRMSQEMSRRPVLRKPVCDDERLSRFDVECVSGEGMLWVFPSVKCNPFSNTSLEAQFHCFISWADDIYTYVILSNSFNTKDRINEVYTMRYETQHIKYSIDNRDTQRRIFHEAKIYYGAVEVKSDDGFFHYDHKWGLPPIIYILEYRIGNIQDPDCDDEVMNCAELCHETLAYINCKKTCSKPRDECLSNRDNNKCQFKKNYVSKWSVHSVDDEEFIADIKDEGIVFYRPDGKKQMSAVCYNEIQSVRHSLNDRYIIQVNDMPKGCRRRRLCLELYQGPYIMKMENNINTLRYRMSRSKIANLYLDHKQLCKFRPDPEPLGERYRSKYMKMMISKDRIQKSRLLPDKCGLYRSMHGKVRDYSGSSSCKEVKINDWSPKECEFHSQLHIEHRGCVGKGLPPITADYRCISTFYSSHLGLTVSDGNNRNLQIHITRNLKNASQYNCWFFDKTSREPKLYKFPTSDCAIFRQSPYSITVDESKASYIYTINSTAESESPRCNGDKDVSHQVIVDDQVQEIGLQQEVLSLQQRETKYRRAEQRRQYTGESHSVSCEPLSMFVLVSVIISWTFSKSIGML